MTNAPKPNIAQIKIMAAELAPKLANTAYFDKFVADPVKIIDSLDSKALAGLDTAQLTAINTEIKREETVAALKEKIAEEVLGNPFKCTACIIGVSIVLALALLGIAILAGPALFTATSAALISYYGTLLSVVVVNGYLSGLKNLFGFKFIGMVAKWACKQVNYCTN